MCLFHRRVEVRIRLPLRRLEGDHLHHLVGRRVQNQRLHAALCYLGAQDAARLLPGRQPKGIRALHHHVALLLAAGLVQETSGPHYGVADAGALDVFLGALLPEEHPPGEVEREEDVVRTDGADVDKLLHSCHLCCRHQVLGALVVHAEGAERVGDAGAAGRTQDDIAAGDGRRQRLKFEDVAADDLHPLVQPRQQLGRRHGVAGQRPDLDAAHR
mmetsp:Transcript_23140/g.58134  ORF Transcript_23140/g.58134 Transcript_23140/m.58134 type:complete len:215 (+) Transcript_23140:260-904(+)